MRGRRSAGFTLIELLIVVVIIAVIAAISIPNILNARKNGNEISAIGSLKVIANTQQLFREADKDGDNTFDFGNLQELSDTSLIDGTLGSGSRSGYLFDTAPGATNRDFLWFALANPVLATSTGDRYFCTNQRGQVFYTTASSVTPNYTSCDIPTNMLLVR